MQVTLSWETMTGLGTLAILLVTMWVSFRSQVQSQTDSILNKIDAMRAASDEGRAKLYGRIDGVVHELRAEFVSKELHSVTVRRIDALDDRVNRACEEVRNRRNGSTLMT